MGYVSGSRRSMENGIGFDTRDVVAMISANNNVMQRARLVKLSV